MKFLILLLFIAVPLAEIAVFIKVGDIIGIGATIALVILTAIIGVALLKRQGLAAMARAQESVDAGKLPVDSVVDGVCLLVAGAFLLTPGLITDTAGFLLLVPKFRRGLAHKIFAKIKESGSFSVHTFGTGDHAGHRPGSDAETPDGPVIDGDFEDMTGDKPERSLETDRPTRDGGKSSPWRK
ncbi:MAG: FxsA family protein [Hyphomicrobiales bacterium]|nr:FxsA family protein [Hyphomicrobiales bacterium]